MVARLRKGEPDKKYEGYELEEDGILIFQGWLYIPNNVELKKVVIDEIHQMLYSGRLGYQNIVTIERKQHFWPLMKRDIT